MTPASQDLLDSFRTMAAAQGLSDDAIEQWAAVARPCAHLTEEGDRPVVGRLGGPLLLPADVPNPARPYVASLDFAALPGEATGLPTPTSAVRCTSRRVRPFRSGTSTSRGGPLWTNTARWSNGSRRARCGRRPA